MNEFSETVARVRYKDTDQMGMVYYGNYFTFFEIGRVEYMRERGIAYKNMEREDESYIVVAEASCRYLRPARYDDLLRIRTRVSESRRRSVRFAYEILRHDSGGAAAASVLLTKFCATTAAKCWPPAKPCTSSAIVKGGRNRCRRNTANFFRSNRKLELRENLRSAKPSGRLQTALRSHERCNRHARFRNRNDPILSAAA